MNLIDFLETLAFAWVIALIAVTYREILLREPVLNWWAKFGARYEKRWFYLPIWGCHKCVAGQLALWLYLWWKLFSAVGPGTYLQLGGITLNAHYLTFNSYSIVGHIFAICGAIYFSNILKELNNRWN